MRSDAGGSVWRVRASATRTRPRELVSSDLTKQRCFFASSFIPQEYHTRLCHWAFNSFYAAVIGVPRRTPACCAARPPPPSCEPLSAFSASRPSTGESRHASPHFRTCVMDRCHSAAALITEHAEAGVTDSVRRVSSRSCVASRSRCRTSVAAAQRDAQERP